ncbi:MAG: hypothetical protein AB1422_19360 [bacterium]
MQKDVGRVGSVKSVEEVGSVENISLTDTDTDTVTVTDIGKA